MPVPPKCFLTGYRPLRTPTIADANAIFVVLSKPSLRSPRQMTKEQIERCLGGPRSGRISGNSGEEHFAVSNVDTERPPVSRSPLQRGNHGNNGNEGHVTKLTASFAAQMTEEEALAILANYDAPIPD
jgi:hypothetical protein